MEAVWLIGLIVLWGLVLINLLLTLRVVRWLRALEDSRARAVEHQDRADLPVGAPAPDFRAKTLSNQTVRLADYSGRAVAFLFVSPNCDQCRQKVPALARLAEQARRSAGVEFVLVSESDPRRTHAWVSAIREEDGVDVELPVLVAPPSTSEFFFTYNPRGLLPFYCVVDEGGIVRSRDPLGMGDWPKLEREWSGLPPAKTLQRSLGRFR